MLFMKINLLPALIISMVDVIFLFHFLGKIVEYFSNLNMNNLMFTALLSFMTLGFQIIWIKYDTQTWKGVMEKYFGIGISAK